jgi:hypothetical protein
MAEDGPMLIALIRVIVHEWERGLRLRLQHYTNPSEDATGYVEGF